MNRQLELKPSDPNSVYLWFPLDHEENILGFTNIILKITSEGIYLRRGKHLYCIRTVQFFDDLMGGRITFNKFPQEYQP